MHEYAPLASTLVAIFAGILVNKSDLKELKADIGLRFENVEKSFGAVDRRFDRLEAKVDRMQADLSEFHRVLGQHDKAIEILERRK